MIKLQRVFERISYNVREDDQIFDISPKIRPYVQDFELNFVLRMFAMMVQFLDISTKICDQNFDQDFGDLDHHFRYFTKMFKILALNFIIFL